MEHYGDNSNVLHPTRRRSATTFSASETHQHRGGGGGPALLHTTVSNHPHGGKGTLSCPDLLLDRSDLSHNNVKEFHRKLQLTVSLSDATQRLAISDSFSRHRFSGVISRGVSPHRMEERPRSALRRCTSSSVSSFRSSSENETISCDESTELDISKVIPEIKIDEPDPQAPYTDRNIAEILDFLFIGDLESANREPLLCRLNVECVVELINLTPQEVMKAIKLKDCPCVCASPMKHSRIRLNIYIDDTIEEDIAHYFEEVNNFIEGAVKSQRHVLVYCIHGNTLSPTVSIQYLMQFQGFRLREAYALMKERRPQINIPVAFQRVLTRLERQLHPHSPVGFVFETPVVRHSPISAKTPEAWT